MRRMLSPVSLRQLGQTESMADEDEFKKNQKIMAAKRTRKTERNKLGKDKDRCHSYMSIPVFCVSPH
jgi:hypothetical protein